MKNKKENNQLVIYQAPSGAIELHGDVAKDTIWATQAQIADIFQAERSVITKHIRNILKDKELRKKMSESARSRVEKYFSINNMVKNHEEIYQDCLKSKVNR